VDIISTTVMTLCQIRDDTVLFVCTSTVSF